MYTMNVHDYSLLLSYFSPKTSVATSSNEPSNACCICHKRLHHLCHDSTLKRLFRWFMGASVIAAVVIDVPIIFGVIFSRDEFPAISENFSNIVAFWQ